MLKKAKSSLIIILILLLVVGCVDQSGSSSSGKDLTIAPTSVVVTQILHELNVPASQVVAIPSTKTYSVPEEYKNAPEIGIAMSPDMEKLSNIKPDIVLGPNSLEGELSDKYKKIGLNAVFLNLKSVSGMFKSIEELGAMLGREEEAKVLVDDFVNYMVEYREKHKHSDSPRVLVLMGLPGGSYVVATESSYVGDLTKLAGATNVYGDGEGQDFINVSIEDMLSKDPDIILRTAHAYPEEVKKYFEEEFSENDIWQRFRAVQDKKVYDLDNASFGMSANFNYKKGLESLEEVLYDNN